MSAFRRYLFAGLLIWIPIGITFLVVKFVVDFLDKLVYLVPSAYRPSQWLGFYIPGIGLMITLLIVFVTGMITANFIGNKLLEFWEKILTKIPIVRSIHTSVKQVLSTFLQNDGQSFRRVLLVEYPRRGMWSVAFQTSSGFKKAEELTENDLVTVFVPTTPNPTSGFLLFVPRNDVIMLDISIEEAMKLVISLGVVLPETKRLPDQ